MPRFAVSVCPCFSSLWRNCRRPKGNGWGEDVPGGSTLIHSSGSRQCTTGGKIGFQIHKCLCVVEVYDVHVRSVIPYNQSVRSYFHWCLTYILEWDFFLRFVKGKGWSRWMIALVRNRASIVESAAIMLVVKNGFGTYQTARHRTFL